MNYRKYQELARRTETIPADIVTAGLVFNFRFNHASLGMTTEIAELFSSDDDGNKKEELGDILWYADLLASAIGTDLGNLPVVRIESEKKDEEYLIIHNGEIADVLKRLVYYRKQYDHNELKQILSTHLSHILGHVISIATTEGFSMSEILELNIEKLRLRYPTKFTEEQALNRDKDRERAVFED